MNHHERRRYDMFIRVDEFGKTNAADFPAGSVGAAQFAEIGDVITQIQTLIGDQTASRDDARFHYGSKATMRENLREEMSDFNETARSMVYQIPGIDLKFRLSRTANDADLLAAARAFYANSEEYNAQMIEYGLPPTFRADLMAAITDFETSLNAPGAAMDSQVEATSNIGDATRRGMQAVKTLEGVVKNKYRSNTGKLAAWLSASHIERSPAKPPAPVNP
ncbi:MAG: hypothetical protein ACR2HG_11575 [Pyrinomonadaceae bacterium]